MCVCVCEWGKRERESEGQPYSTGNEGSKNVFFILHPPPLTLVAPNTLSSSAATSNRSSDLFLLTGGFEATVGFG